VSSHSADPPERTGATLRPASATDLELVAAAAGGHRGALDELLRRHQGRMYGICLRMAGNESDARDATQEAMLAVCRGVARFDQRSAFSTWVYRVTTNACLDELRRRTRRPIASGSADELATASSAGGGNRTSSSPAGDDAVVARLTLDDALARLPDDFRAALVLRDLCELDYAEIAEVLDIPPGTVRSRIARARGALARDLGNQTPCGERPTKRP
jgi:RNA polymerase sigma-70 factor (ECF subfamily)